MGRAAIASTSARIEGALRSLLTRGKGAFVILEDRASKKFVQFAGSSTEPLLLDLPSQTLDREETQRAIRFFEALGVRRETWNAEARGGRRYEQSGFQLDLGADVARATELATRVFQEIYRVPAEFTLEITED